MVPLIENEIVTKRKWIAQEDFIDLLAISQSAPGILAVNISCLLYTSADGVRPFDLAVEQMFGSSPKTYMVDKTVERHYEMRCV